MRYFLNELSITADTQYTCFAVQVTYIIKLVRKDKVLLQSNKQDEIENWLRANLVVDKMISNTKILTEATARALTTFRLTPKVL